MILTQLVFINKKRHSVKNLVSEAEREMANEHSVSSEAASSGLSVPHPKGLHGASLVGDVIPETSPKSAEVLGLGRQDPRGAGGVPD